MATPTFGEKLKSKIGRTFSTKSKSTPEDSRRITRVSETLEDDSVSNLPPSPEKKNHRRQESESAYSDVSNVKPTGFSGIV